MDDFIKNAGQELSFYINKILNGGRTKTILFYPEYPHRRTIIYKILKHLKCSFTSNPGHKFDLAFFWEDKTFREEQNIFKTYDAKKVININCTDISKKNISQVFEKAFGYSLNINAKTYSGECVKKNNLNAKHDGITVQCPVENPEEGFVYQKVINNKFNDNLVFDIRTPVLKGHIPFVYLKFKEMKDRFTNDLYKSEMASVNEYLTNDEIKKTADFSFMLGLDYGELDILRNNDDGKIYIVDVNYTPWGPPAKLDYNESSRAVLRMSDVFKNIYLK